MRGTTPEGEPQYAVAWENKMARHGSKIEPNLELRRYGIDDGWVIVTPDGVSITISQGERKHKLADGHSDPYCEEMTIMLNPEYAPLFRMIANRLDEIRERDRG
jgi:hypothetical protein